MHLGFRFSVVLFGLIHLNTWLFWESSKLISWLNSSVKPHVLFQEMALRVYAVMA